MACWVWQLSRQFSFIASGHRYIRRVPDDEVRPLQMIEVRPGYFRASWPMAAGDPR